MQFSGKFERVVCWYPRKIVDAPTSRISWIRHCPASSVTNHFITSYPEKARCGLSFSLLLFISFLVQYFYYLQCKQKSGTESPQSNSVNVMLILLVNFFDNIFNPPFVYVKCSIDTFPILWNSSDRIPKIPYLSCYCFLPPWVSGFCSLKFKVIIFDKHWITCLQPFTRNNL